MRNTHTIAHAIIYYVAKIRCVTAPRTRRKKRKSTPLWSAVFVLLFGAYRHWRYMAWRADGTCN